MKNYGIYKGLVRRSIHNKHDVDDVYHNALLKFYSYNPDLNDRFPHSFLYQAIQWAITDYYRDKYRMHRKYLPEEVLTLAEFDRDFRELSNLVLSKAPQHVHLQIQGFSQKEIARILNTTVNAVKAKKFKFIRKARKYLLNDMYV